MKNNNFDLLRLFAAIQVVFIHSFHHLFDDFGYKLNDSVIFFKEAITFIPGVPIFFLISGFLISLSYEKNPNIKDYITNRVLRIYPALYINILISFIILYHFNFVTFDFTFFGWLIAQMSIVQFYNAEMFRGFGVGVINGSLWTISVELCFYIALPIIFFLFKKSRWIIIFFFIISFTLWVYDITSDKDIFYNKLLHVTIVPYFFLFLIGVCFYKYFEKIKYLIENNFLAWVVCFAIFNMGINYLHVELNILLYLVKWIIFSFMVFSFAFSYNTLSRKLLKGRDYTYGIYIYHMLIINVFVYFNFVAEIKYFLYVFFSTIALGAFSWHLIEKPFLKMKKHSLFNELHK